MPFPGVWFKADPVALARVSGSCGRGHTLGARRDLGRAEEPVGAL